MTLIGKNIFIYGGHSSDTVYNDLFKLNKLTLIWEKVNIKGFIPPTLTGIAGARVGKKIYITGGCDFLTKVCNEDTFIFDTDKPNWEKLPEKQK